MYFRSPIVFAVVLTGVWPCAAEAGTGDDAASLPRITGQHYQIVCHFRNAEPADALDALALAEAVWPQALAFFHAWDVPPVEPLEIHLYDDRAAFDRILEALPAEYAYNRGFTDGATRTAHIPVTRWLRHDGPRRLPLSVLQSVAHEAAHLAHISLIHNARWYPRWLTEGCAMEIEDRVMTERGLRPYAEADPYCGQLLRQVQNHARAGELPALESILRDRIPDQADLIHSAAWTLVRFLTREQPERWQELMAQAALLGWDVEEPRPKRRELRAFANRVLDVWAERAETLASRFEQYARRPALEWLAKSGALETSDELWLQYGLPTTEGRAWCMSFTGGGDFLARGRVRILPGGAEAAGVLIGVPGDCTLVTFEEGGACVEHSRNGGEYDALTRWRPARIQVQVPFAFEIRVRDDVLSVVVDGREVIAAPLPARPTRERWGLATRLGATALWSDVEAGGDRHAGLEDPGSDR